MLKQIAYTGMDGKQHPAGYLTASSAYQLTGHREQFARLMAQSTPVVEAYCLAYEQTMTPENAQSIERQAKKLAGQTAVVLRIAELQKPVLRKIHRKIEYGLQQAFEQCQVAYDLAFEQGNVKGILAAIEMQAKLAKLLSEEINVTHRHGLLDETATEVLLAMKKEIEVRHAKGKQFAPVIEGELVIRGEGG